MQTVPPVIRVAWNDIPELDLASRRFLAKVEYLDFPQGFDVPGHHSIFKTVVTPNPLIAPKKTGIVVAGFVLLNRLPLKSTLRSLSEYRRQQQLRILLAFLAIYVIWGTTYLAMAIAVKTIPPFAIAGSRFLIAGVFLVGLLRVRGIALPTASQWKSAALIGCLLMIGGNGLVMWGIQRIPSGICAVVIATMPMWMCLFDWCFYRGPRPGWVVLLGLITGFGGIVMLVGPADWSVGEGPLHWPSLLAVICAPIFWSLGSLQSRKIDLPDNVFMATGAQMICGGLALSLISVAMNEPAGIRLQDITLSSLAAVAWLTLFGSLVALTSYMWLLKNAPASRVATYTYVNPVIAVFLGWLILDEVITLQTVAAIAIIVSAVAIIVTFQAKGKGSASAQDAS